jgi:hypothetical protein
MGGVMKNSRRKAPAIRAKTGRSAPERKTRKKVESTAVVAVGRDERGKFLKNFSGNPNGRPKTDLEFKGRAQEYAPEALETLVDHMRHGDRVASIAAAKEILSRAYGRPSQPITGMPGASLVNITLNGGGSIDPGDYEAIYRELCGNPSLDISGLTFDAPRAAELIEHPPQPELKPDPPPTETDQARLFAKLGKDS